MAMLVYQRVSKKTFPQPSNAMAANTDPFILGDTAAVETHETWRHAAAPYLRKRDSGGLFHKYWGKLSYINLQRISSTFGRWNNLQRNFRFTQDTAPSSNYTQHKFHRQGGWHENPPQTAGVLGDLEKDTWQFLEDFFCRLPFWGPGFVRSKGSFWHQNPIPKAEVDGWVVDENQPLIPTIKKGASRTLVYKVVK